jgi:hypothetical protein
MPVNKLLVQEVMEQVATTAASMLSDGSLEWLGAARAN